MDMINFTDIVSLVIASSVAQVIIRPHLATYAGMDAAYCYRRICVYLAYQSVDLS